MYDVYLRQRLSLAWACGCVCLLIVGATPSVGAATPGVLHAWGFGATGNGTVPANLGPVIQAAGGWQFSLAIRPSGSVVAWGNTGPVPSTLPACQAVAAGQLHSLALGVNGSVYSWGDFDNRLVAPLTGITAIAAGEAHSLALRANGSVVAWGRNDSGQALVPALAASGVKAIAAGGQHSLALLNGGRVVGWGLQPGSLVPNAALNNIIAISAGETHSLALRSDRTVIAWGQFNSPETLVPAGLSGVKAIAAGGRASLAVLADGSVRVWGDNSFFQLDRPPALANMLRVAGGAFHFLAIQVDPPVITEQPLNSSVLVGNTATFSVGASGSQPLAYQWMRSGTNLPLATNAVLSIPDTKAADAGVYSVVVQNDAGAVASLNATLVVRQPPAITSHPEGVTAGEGSRVEFRVVATGPSLRYIWRRNQVVVSTFGGGTFGIDNVAMINAGTYDVIVTNIYGAVTSAPAVLVVEPLPVITAHPQSMQVFPGSPSFVEARATNATGIQWLKNGAPIPGAHGPRFELNPTTASDQASYSLRATNQWGTVDSASATITWLPRAPFSEVIGWGDSDYFDGQRILVTTPPAGLGGIVQAASGGRHGLALRSDGFIIAWGDNTSGQGFVPTTAFPAASVAAGDGFSLAMRRDGTVVSWGRSGVTLSQPPGLSGVIAISAGLTHALALRADGTLAAWGSNLQGEGSVPPNIALASGIASGHGFNLAILRNGTVTGWGRNEAGQRRPPPGLSNVVQVAAGRAHGLALRSDGTLVGWGDNSFGQLNIPDSALKAAAIAAGADHSMALLPSGQVAVWGRNNFGQTDVPAEASFVVGMSGGGDQCFVLRRRGLQLALPRIGAGRLRVSVLSGNGELISPDRVPNIRLYGSDSLLRPFSEWTLLPPPQQTEAGEVRLLDIVDPAPSRRFYRAYEAQ